MKIAVLYDTFETHKQPINDLYCDFNDESSMKAVARALIRSRYDVTEIFELDQIKNEDFSKYDLVFNVFEGTHSRNREALIPGKLELYNIPFVGADSYVAIVSLDKILSKLIATYLGIQVPKFLEYSCLDDLNQDIKKLKTPLIVKPCSEGNSASTSPFEKYEEAENFIRKLIKRYNGRVLCEEFIEGKELTVPIIGNGESAYCLGVAGYEEQNDDGFWLDYKYKLFGGLTDCIAQIPKETKDLIMNQALTFYKYIGCLDYGRIDFRLDKNGTPFFLELNAYPTLCTNGSFAVLGKEMGMNYDDIITKIVDAAIKRVYASKTI